jgi:hypothetical protein
MKTMNRQLSAAILGVAFFATLCVRAEERANPQIVKFPELAKIVQENRGKIVVVDLWAEW